MNDETQDQTRSDHEEPTAPEEREEQGLWGEAPTAPLWDPISRLEFENLLGGRIFAWIGGIATLLGLVFLMRIAIGEGWVNEEIRTLLATLGSLTLFSAGIWLHERKRHIELGRIAVATSIAGLFATAVVASQTYDLISPLIGLELAALIGVVAVFVAVRWSSMLVAGIGVLGALAAPLLVGAETDGGSIAFVAVALAASVGVLLWQRWGWLALGAFAVSVPQLVAWVFQNEGESTLLVLAVLAGFWLLYVAAAFGYELRTRAEKSLPAASWMLLLGATTLVVGTGCVFLDRAGEEAALNAWVFGFAAAHLLLGAAAVRFGIHREIGSLLIGGGIGLGSFGFANAVDGPTLVAVWAAAAATCAFLATRADATPSPTLSNAQRLLLGSAAFIGLALVHVLVVEAPPTAIANGVADLGSSLVAIACCAAAALAFWHFGRRVEPLGRRWPDSSAPSPSSTSARSRSSTGSAPTRRAKRARSASPGSPRSGPLPVSPRSSGAWCGSR